MRYSRFILLTLAVLALCVLANPVPANKPISIDSNAPPDAGVPLESFVAYSIEFSSFPEFAGKTNVVQNDQEA